MAFGIVVAAIVMGICYLFRGNIVAAVLIGLVLGIFCGTAGAISIYFFSGFFMELEGQTFMFSTRILTHPGTLFLDIWMFWGWFRLVMSFR